MHINTYRKVVRVIASCKTKQQLEVLRKYVTLAIKNYTDSKEVMNSLFTEFIRKEIEIEMEGEVEVA